MAKKLAIKAAPLLQYLVTIQHSMDDVPVFLTDDRNEAMLAAHNAPDDGMIPKKILRALGMSGPSTPGYVSIITFMDGIPVNREIVREYE